MQLKDSLGRTMQYRYEDGLLSDVVHMDQGVTHYEYDERGFLVCAVDQAKVAYLRNEYDQDGRVVLQTLADGSTYKAEYSRDDRTVRVDSSVGNKTVLYTCGAGGDVLSMDHTDGTRQGYTYDKAGNRTGSTDRMGNETTWKYDAAGRMVEEAKPGGLVTTSRYDGNGDLVLEQDNAGRRTERRYDGHHNVVSMTENGKTTSYSYDRMGRLTEMVDARGKPVYYVIDPQ